MQRVPPFGLACSKGLCSVHEGLMGNHQHVMFCHRFGALPVLAVVSYGHLTPSQRIDFGGYLVRISDQPCYDQHPNRVRVADVPLCLKSGIHTGALSLP